MNHRLAKLQMERNSQTSDGWERFAFHRKRVTGLLTSLAGDARPQRLCILGAGNCNDLDLPSLMPQFDEVHLVDIDGDALAAGVQRQGIADSPQLRLHRGVDVTGVFDRLNRATFEDAAQWKAAIQTAAHGAELTYLGQFDVIASVCLLTQLIDGVLQTLGQQDEKFLEFIKAVRSGHLSLCRRLLKPGGHLALVSDVVSSESFSSLAKAPPESLAGVISTLVRQGNFFTGANPFILRALLERGPSGEPWFEKVRGVQPWLWDLGPRVYAVCAFVAARPAEKS